MDRQIIFFTLLLWQSLGFAQYKDTNQLIPKHQLALVFQPTIHQGIRVTGYEGEKYYRALPTFDFNFGIIYHKSLSHSMSLNFGGMIGKRSYKHGYKNLPEPKDFAGSYTWTPNSDFNYSDVMGIYYILPFSIQKNFELKKKKQISAEIGVKSVIRSISLYTDFAINKHSYEAKNGELEPHLFTIMYGHGLGSQFFAIFFGVAYEKVLKNYNRLHFGLQYTYSFNNTMGTGQYDFPAAPEPAYGSFKYINNYLAVDFNYLFDLNKPKKKVKTFTPIE